MSEPFIGQIVQFGGNFAPRGWAFCNGQLLSISQNTALFSILGTTYGGDGRTTFGLPELRGRVPMHPGDGPGLAPRNLGEKGGTESNTLTTANLPSHTHGIARDAETTTNRPSSSALPARGNRYADSGDVVASPATGGSQAFTNIQPYQCINFLIALQGIFPSRN